MEPTVEDIERAADVLQYLAGRDGVATSEAISRLYRSAKHFLTQQNRRLNVCGIRQLRNERAIKNRGLIGGVLSPVLAIEATPLAVTPIELLSSQQCYVCKAGYMVVHHFYDKMCSACGDRNFAKRSQTADLRGKRAIVTGGRIKIGYEIALKLLRAGAHVIVTTRFAADAHARFAKESDYREFVERLDVYPLDMLDFGQVARFVRWLKCSDNQIDFLINNAAQTIFRPSDYYRAVEGRANNEMALTACNMFFPIGVVDEHGIQVDYREQNTWTMPVEETPTLELLQVTAVNYIVPFYLMKELYSLYGPNAYVINVTAMEGKFSCYKTGYHAHTNGAKAALNMLTRTVGDLWAKQKVYVACVDTGWVTNEYPINREADLESKYHPPLDEVDGAARVLDPIFCDLKPRGVFYKDYSVTNW